MTDCDKLYSKTISKKSAYLWFAIIIIGCIAITFHLTSSDVQTASLAWGISLFLSGILLAFFGDERFDMFSPIFFFGMTFSIFYGVSMMSPFFLEEGGSYSRIIDWVLPYYPTAGLVSFLCLMGFLAGYKSRLAETVGKRSTILFWKGGSRSLKYLWAFLFGNGVLAFVLLIANNAYLQSTTVMQSPLFYSAVGFIQNGLIVSVTMALFIYLQRRTRFWLIAAVTSVFITMLFGIPSGSKTLTLLAFMLVGVAMNYHGKRFSRAFAAWASCCTMLLLLILMPFNALYRSIQLSGSHEQSLSSSFEMIGSALEEMSTQDFLKTKDVAVNYFFARLSNISVVANILRYQDEGGIVHYGGSYLRLFYALIPRFFWPDKPPLTIGQMIAVELGYGDVQSVRLGEASSNTSVGITMVGEQVYNFTWVLAPIGMFVFGMFYRWLYETFLSAKDMFPEVSIGVYSFWWYALVFSAGESNYAAILAGGIKYTVLLFILLMFFKFQRFKQSEG